jgi:hypothetical protein
VGYVKNVWVNGDESKPLDQVRLNHNEDGTFLAAATADSAAAGVVALNELTTSGRLSESEIVDTIESTASAVSVSYFGAVGDGVADDTVALEAALTSGKSVMLTPGETYRVTSSIVVGDNTHVVATGATLLIDHTESGIVSAGSISTPITVTTINPISASNAPSGLPSDNFDLVLSSPAPSDWVIGDKLVIAADNEISGARDTGNGNANQNRVGAFLTVVSTSGSTVRASGILDDTLSVNVRIGKLDTDHKFSWTGGTVEFTDTAFESALAPFVLTSVFAPVISNVTVPRVRYAAVYMRGCLNWQIDKLRVLYGVNDLSDSSFGYGVMNIASSYGVLSNSYFSMLRHGYTNGATFVAAGVGNLGFNGRPTDNTIANCVGDSCTSSPFDSHTQGRREHFTGCAAKNSSTGFFLRGQYNTVTDCTASWCTNAVIISCEGYGGRAFGHAIDGLTCRSVQIILECRVNDVSGSANYDVKESFHNTISNVRSSSQSGRMIVTRNARVIAHNFFIRYTGEDNNIGALVVNSDVYFRNVHLHNDTARTGLTFASFAVDGHASPESIIETVDVRVVNNAVAAFDYFVAGTITGSTFRGRDVWMEAAPTTVKEFAYPSTGYVDLTF